MTTDNGYLPFSQRTGLAPVPPQLDLGQVSDEFRRQVYYFLSLEFERRSEFGWDNHFFREDWKRVTKDLHVLFFKRSINDYENSVYEISKKIQTFVNRSNIGELFDFLEFLVRHSAPSAELKSDLKGVFISTRSAYRIIDLQVVAIGNTEQAEAFEAAVSSANEVGSEAARSHLLDAGLELRNANWANSVRESIHAVEAMARWLEPTANTLGPALSNLEDKGHLHGALKAAFGSLYGYSSDEAGVRHAKVFSDEAAVDETDALFMLGACSSFVSYLAAKGG